MPFEMYPTDTLPKTADSHKRDHLCNMISNCKRTGNNPMLTEEGLVG